MRNPLSPAEIVADEHRVSITVMFAWNPAWALDKCEVNDLIGDLHRLLVRHYGTDRWEKVAGLLAVATWDPVWESVVGFPMEPVMFERKEA